MKTKPALSAGANQSIRLPKLVVFFYLINLATAAAAVAPAAALIGQHLAHSLESDRLFANADPAWIIETLTHYRFGPLTTVTVAIAAVGGLFFVLQTFLSGGALAVFHREGEPYFSACARHFPRLFRLMLVSLVLYGMVLALNAGITAAIERGRQSSMEAHTWIILGWIRLALVFFLLGVVNMVFDYGKIACIIGETRSALRATVRALRFVWSHPGRTLAVYWVCAAAGFLVLFAYHEIAEAAGQGTGAAIALVFVLRQCCVLARTWVRLWTWSAELHVYSFSPTIVAPIVPSPAEVG